MEKKIRQSIYIILVIVMLIAPSFGMLSGKEVTPSANEVLSQAPSIVTEDGKFNINVLKDTSSYIGDHFARRKELATAWASVGEKAFQTSVDDQVTSGKDGWLFYTDTVTDYAGLSLSDETILEIAENLLKIQNCVESKGHTFVFTIAPNKNSLYPQYMNSIIPSNHENSTAAKLKKILEEKGVHYVDLFDAFANEPVLYYRTDSHWTPKGAALGADAILKAVGKNSDYYNGTYVGTAPHKGDLYEMLYPSGTMTEARETLSGEFGFVEDTPTKEGMAITIKTHNDSEEGSVLCWRDSFGADMHHYIADSFGSACFVRDENYDLEKRGADDYDVVIIELVERNLYRLAGDSVVLPEM